MVKKSGNNRIDSLLKDKYWNEAGKSVSLTYSMDTTGSDGFDSAEQAMIREALQRWQDVANITFRQVSSGGNLRFKGQSGTGGLASYKTATKWWDPTSWGTNKLDHVNVKIGKASATGRGNRFLEVALHEIGHALGLKHPGNYNGATGKGKAPFLPYAEDNNTNTLMTYNDVGNYAATPMAYDIRAVQYLYGAKTYNSGNTAYEFSTVHSHTNGYYADRGSASKRMKLSLWDSGGTDTVDFSKLAARSTGYRFDINDGGMLTTQDAFNATEYRPRDNGKDTSSLRYKTTAYGTSVAYGAKIENVVGSSSNDVIVGNGLSNTLMAGAGNDSIYSGAGHDTVRGGDGDDFLGGWSGNDYLYGGNGNDRMYGDSGIDRLYGGNGNDKLHGHTNNSGVVSTLGPDNNPDYLYGEDGNDWLNGYNGNDYLYGGDDNDSLYGSNGDDYLSGGTGNDYLDGGAGSDRMYGWTGNDRYVVDSTGDKVVEYAGYGTDRVYSYINYTLGDNVEHLTLRGTVYRGYGNALNNQIVGNSSNNYLWGADGNDSLYGYGGNDTLSGGNDNDYLYGGKDNDSLYGGLGNDYLDGGSGNDYMAGGAGNDNYVVDSTSDVVAESAGYGTDRVYSDISYTLGDHLEQLTLRGAAYRGYGNALNNQIVGNNSNNYLWGAGGNDSLYGYGGNDTLSGSNGDDYLNAGAGDDYLTGGAGTDRLLGSTGDDLLVGGSGNDTLSGGTGADRFKFNYVSDGIDWITDFSQAESDKIEVWGSGFGGGLAKGVLQLSQFVLGSAATDASDRFLYNSSTGALSYDADGSGTGAAVQFATLSTGTSLSHTDIVVV